MVGKILEIIVLLLGLLVTAAIVVKIPMDSYNAHKDYLAQVEEQMKENEQASIKPKLESLTVELKEGVKYYANDLADAKVEHFTVTANYTKGEESYSEPVEEGKFTVSTPDDFYAHGGDITITYRGVSAKITVELVPVVIEALEVVENPYTVKYAQGTTFDASGMVIQAVYNDGSTKILASDAYKVDTTTALSLSNKEVTVTYGSGESAKTVKVSISVAETVVDGEVKSISVFDAIVNAGDTLDKTSMTVIATYESGNRKALSADEYTVSASGDATKFGKEYELTVAYKADTTKTAKTDVTVRYTLQGEDGVIVGGSKKTEDEYAVVDGAITKLGNTVSFAGNFSKSVTNGSEGSLTLYIDAVAGTQIGEGTQDVGTQTRGAPKRFMDYLKVLVNDIHIGVHNDWLARILLLYSSHLFHCKAQLPGQPDIILVAESIIMTGSRSLEKIDKALAGAKVARCVPRKTAIFRPFVKNGCSSIPRAVITDKYLNIDTRLRMQ